MLWLPGRRRSMTPSRPCSPGHLGPRPRAWTEGLPRNSFASGRAPMLYALICTDKPGALPVRMANRPQHVEYLKSLGDIVVLAGPFLAEDGATMNGSLIIVEAPSLDAARDIAAGDPFVKTGVFADIQVRPWLWTINPPDEEE